MIDWDEAFEEQSRATGKANDAVDPVKLKAKLDAEFQRGVRLGWWDADGNPIAQDDDSDEDNDDDPPAEDTP